MALEGTLEDFSLADIFQLIGIQRKTGILALKNMQETVTVTFHNGMVIGADSSPKKLEDRLGKVLVKTGLITQDQLRDALELQQKTLQKIGFILVDQNYLTREELKEALQIQVAQMIYRIFRWNKGEYYFDQKTRVDPNADESIPPMSAESILMEGIQMIDEWPVIQKRIPNFDIVFRPVVSLDDIELSESDGDADFDAFFDGDKEDVKSEASEKIRLSKEEESLFRMVDGQNTVADIIEGSKLGEFHTCKALYDLLERKIIEPVGADAQRMADAEPTLTPEMFEERVGSFKYLYPILALLVAAGIYFSYKDPLRLTVFKFFQEKDINGFRTGTNNARLNLIDSALMMHYYIHGKLPERLEELVQKNYLSAEHISDSSSRPYSYEVTGDSYVLSAHTKDGRLDETLQLKNAMNTVEPVRNSKSPTEN